MWRRALALRVIAAAGLLTVQACRDLWRADQEPRVTVEAAVVEAAPSGQTARVYFILRTNNDPTKLVALSNPSADEVQLRTMERADDRPLRAGETTFDPARPLIFSKNGSYGLLMRTNVKAGETIPLTFHVEPAEAVSVRVPVVTEQR